MGDGDRKNGPIHDNGLVEGKDAPPLDKISQICYNKEVQGFES